MSKKEKSQEEVSKETTPIVAEEKKEAPIVHDEVNKPVGVPKEADIETKKDEPKSIEEKVISFLKSRNTGAFIPINDFLKSLYPQVGGSTPKAWHDQRTMKLLRVTIEGWVSDRIVVVEGNLHQRLARPYDPDGTPSVTHYYNLDTLLLKAKLP